MRTALFFAIAAAIGTLLNFFASLVLTRLVKRKSELRERVRISSIEDAHALRRKSQLTEEEMLRLWSDTMNILMTAETEEEAARYTERVALSLGDRGDQFRRSATSIMRTRFTTTEVEAA